MLQQLRRLHLAIITETASGQLRWPNETLVEIRKNSIIVDGVDVTAFNRVGEVF